MGVSCDVTSKNRGVRTGREQMTELSMQKAKCQKLKTMPGKQRLKLHHMSVQMLARHSRKNKDGPETPFSLEAQVWDSQKGRKNWVI